MTKNTGRLDQLFALHLNQSATELEQEEFWGYVNDPMYEQEVKDLVARLYSESENVSMISEDERTAILAEVFSKQRISAPITALKTRKLNLWPRIAIAAALATIIFGAGLFYYYLNNNREQANQVALKNDVGPGHQGATLTLASGKKIKLSDAVNGKLAKEAGVLISKSAEGQLVYEIKESSAESNKINTLTTAKGETYKLRLPDGSLVVLNAASSLEYPTNFSAVKQRRVRLTGEGYFEIAKDKAHPFIVKTNRQEVEVLGTHFNVNNYEDESETKTALLEGSVKINNDLILKPGEEAATNRTNGTKISEINVNKAVAWKNGKFVFTSESIESIMRKLARWYDVEVIYQGDFSDKRFTGSISRYDNISKILDKITFTQAVHFKIEGRRITIMP